jgi:rRNA processing protein Gar1
LRKKFEKLLDDDDDTSVDSSSSTLTSSSDDSSSDVENSAAKKATVKSKKFVPVRIDDVASGESDDEEKGERLNQVKYIKTKDEITFDELPAPERIDLVLDPGIKLEKIGRVISKVDKLVVIQSIINESRESSPPLDEDTILFDSNRKALGKIFEIFGPVNNPFYSLRFASLTEIEERALDLNTDSSVYVAQSAEYTKFIFNVEEIRQMKGSDASWSNDNEPPVDCLEYSDDEQEREAKRLLKNKNKKLVANYSSGEEDSDAEEGEEKDDTKSVCSMSSNNDKSYRGNNRNFNRMNKSQSQNAINNGSRGQFQNNKRQFNSHVPKSQTFSNQPPGNFNNNNNNQQYGQQHPGQQFYGGPHPNMFWPHQQPPPPHMMHMQPPQYPMPMSNYMGMPMHFSPFMPPNYYNQFPPGMNPYQQHVSPSTNQPPHSNNAPYQNFNRANNNNTMNSNNKNRRPQQAPIGPQQPGTSANFTDQPNIVDKRFVQNSNYIKKSF